MIFSVFIEKGCTRTVFVFERFVIKIPTFLSYKLFLNGLLANIQEREFNGVHDDLAPILSSNKFGLFIVMKRAIPVDNDLAEWLLNTVEEKYKDDPLKEFLLSDCKPTNWGYIDGKLVKIDYGN